MMISTRVAGKLAKFHKRYWRELTEEVIQDVAQDFVAAFYALKEFERPASEQEYVFWAWELGRTVLRQKKYATENEVPLIDSADSLDDDDDLRRSSHMYWYSQPPTQMIYVQAMEALRKVFSLPNDMRQKVLRVIYSGDVAEYAKDYDVSLFDAMKDILHIRQVMARLADDDRDERRELQERKHGISQKWNGSKRRP